MRRIMIRLVLAMAAGAAVLVPASPAAAASPVFVEVYANQAYWPVKTGLSVVDTYTSSYLVYGRCRSGYGCIKVYERLINSSYAAITYNWSWGSQIYLNPQRRGYAWNLKARIVTHEGAHARGVYWHNPYCTTVMYGRVTCPNGSWPPRKSHYTEIAQLRRY